MSLVQLIAALSPFIATFGANLTDEQWNQYHLALGDVNTGDLDDAMADLRKTHAFRNAPLPAEILERCGVHRKRRIVNQQIIQQHITVDPKDGEWKTHTVPGLGSVRMFVLPDDHPALPRYKCGRCKDTGWEEQPGVHPVSKKAIYFRCACRKKQVS